MVKPENPTISFTDVDDSKAKEWMDEKMEETESWEQEWADVWSHYMNSISEPWNQFVTAAEEYTVRGAELDAKTDQEVFTWIAENTFIDGVAAIDKYP